MKTRATLAALVALAVAASLLLTACSHSQGTQGTARPDEANVTANFDVWKSALATKDPKAVAALFSPTGVLEPTVSNQIRDTPAEIEDYFHHFLQKSPVPTINERYVRILDENTAIDAGIWTFALTTNGTTSEVTARYSFVWEKIEGVWKIQLLHSSMMPEPVAATQPT